MSNAYNASQKDVYISLEIVDNSIAAGNLKTQIAAGNAPDIIGPVGIEGLNLFRDQLLDLAPLVASSGYTQPGVDPKLTEFFKIGEGGSQIGLPFASIRRSSSSTRTSSTRPSWPIPRPRSATSTKASRGTWTPSASWA